MPLKDVALYQDVLGMLKLPEITFAPVETEPARPIRPPRLPSAPEQIRRREAKRQETLKQQKARRPPANPRETVVVREVAAEWKGLNHAGELSGFLNVIVNRDTSGDGHQTIWMLLDTRAWEDPRKAAVGKSGNGSITCARPSRRGVDGLKCFWDLTGFTSRAFSLVVNQIVFVALA